MLVVTRKVNEAIIIGDQIEVRILRVGREGVRIGITAASDVPVHRREVYDEIRAANAVAAADSEALRALASEWGARKSRVTKRS